MKYNWQIQISKWAIQVSWVGQFTTPLPHSQPSNHNTRLRCYQSHSPIPTNPNMSTKGYLKHTETQSILIITMFAGTRVANVVCCFPFLALYKSQNSEFSTWHSRMKSKTQFCCTKEAIIRKGKSSILRADMNEISPSSSSVKRAANSRCNPGGPSSCRATTSSPDSNIIVHYFGIFLCSLDIEI